VSYLFFQRPLSGYDSISVVIPALSIFNGTYLEGGPEASLYFSAAGMELEKAGIYGTGLNGSVVRSGAYPIPKVIGITESHIDRNVPRPATPDRRGASNQEI